MPNLETECRAGYGPTNFTACELPVFSSMHLPTALVICVGVVCVGCTSSEPTDAQVCGKTISVTPPTASLAVGDSVRASASLGCMSGGVYWRSSADSIAGVTTLGVIRG